LGEALNREIVFPRRSFRDVHQLVFLVQSWQLLVEADLPFALRPLREVPSELAPVVTRLLRSARDQLDSAQAGSEISLRFPATPEFAALLDWAAGRLSEVARLADAPDLEPAWASALGLASEFVDAARRQFAADPTP
jgi:hypothetical protein